MKQTKHGSKVDIFFSPPKIRKKLKEKVTSMIRGDELINQLSDQLSQHLDLGNSEQIKLDYDIKAETNNSLKLMKMIQLSIKIFNENVHTNDCNISEQNKRLIEHLNHCVSFFEILSSDIKDENQIQQFLNSKNYSTTLRLVPKQYFETLSNEIRQIAEQIKEEANTNFENSFDFGNENKEEFKSILCSFDENELIDKIKEIRKIRSKVDFMKKPEEIKNVFYEICSLFELTTLFLTFKFKKGDGTDTNSQSNQLDSIELQKEIEKLKTLLQQKEQENDSLNKENESLKESLSKETENSLSNESETENKLSLIQNENEQLKREIQNIKNLYEECQKENEILKQERSKSEETLSDEMSTIQSKFAAYQKQAQNFMTEKEEEIEKLETQNKQISLQLQNKQKEINQLMEKINENDSNNHIKNEIDTLKSLLEQKEYELRVDETQR